MLPKLLLTIIALFVISTACTYQFPLRTEAPSQQTTKDWREKWEVAENLVIEEDSTGFKFPSAIAFVPEPGSSPKDPLYFVAELRGIIKVVTVDRSVYTFATVPYLFQPDEELPSVKGEGGIGGICLDPNNGYVFVTLLYTGKDGILRNNIMRYSTEPITFSIYPNGVLDFVDIFDQYTSGLAHQIGGCRVAGNQLFVGIGDGWQPFTSQDKDQMNGKIIRMNLDGMPLPDNPFYVDSDPEKARNHVWATGLRNPFAIHIVESKLYVADNGVSTDRFLKIDAGKDYYWNGEENSLHIAAEYIWFPSLGPVSL